jgi:uncharacterized coiled-coil protein SlyX
MTPLREVENRDLPNFTDYQQDRIEALKRRIAEQDLDIAYLNAEILKWQQIAADLREEYWK